MDPTELSRQLGRWSAGRGQLPVLLAARLRELIDEGGLPPGTRLPADRVLSATLAVGRSTVVAAYDELRQEGRIVRRQGSGTRIAGRAPSATSAATTSAPMFLHLLEPPDEVLQLTCAAPESPPPEVQQAYRRALAELSGASPGMGYHPAGHPKLRETLAEYYTRRGVPTAPDRIMVTNGGQQALSLLARALLRPADQVLVEAPTYPGILEVLREHAARPRALPVGLSGFPDAVQRHRPALGYLVSTFHNPTGAVLPALLRRRLARYAAESGTPLIDDEVLRELAFPGQEIPAPLAACQDTVISVGSLSKAVWGGLRTGWIRAPTPLIRRLARLRAVHDLGGEVPAQLATAELLPQLENILRRRTAQLHSRHEMLHALLAGQLPDWEAPAVTGGQTLWVRLPHGDACSFAQTALRHGVAVLPGRGLDASGHSDSYLRIPFLLEAEHLTEAVRRLTAAWHSYVPTRQRAAAVTPLTV